MSDIKTVADLIGVIGDTEKYFTVEFIKRTTGETRVMVARTGVSKGVTGVGRKFKPEDKNLLGVYEQVRGEGGRFTDGQFRMINVPGITKISAGGKNYTVDNGVVTEVAP